MNGPTLPPPPMSPPPMSPPPTTPPPWAVPPRSGPSGRSGVLLLFAGFALTALVAVGVIKAWPEDTDGTSFANAVLGGGTTTTVFGAAGEPSREVTTPTQPTTSGASLFAGGLPGAVDSISKVAGHPDKVIELTIFNDYAFVAYVDPASPGNIDRRMWRAGKVDAASPNPIDDRVNGDTQPKLFSLSELHLDVLPGLVADAPSHYDQAVHVTHVIIERFLPFDERVLILVYSTPNDGRSGGGYVSYDTNGQLVKVCC